MDDMEREKLAIIGAGDMAQAYADRARELGVETHCFAWEKGAVAKDHADFFHPISIFEKEEIVRICRQVGVQGVVSTTELTVAVCADIQQTLGLPLSLSLSHAESITNKGWVRERTGWLRHLRHPDFLRLRDAAELSGWTAFPAIVKPASEGGKRGVLVAENEKALAEAVAYALSFDKKGNGVVIEQYVAEGRECSVECLSSCGTHQVVQITEKISSGPPHCVELGHHQPARLSREEEALVREGVPELLDAVSFQNGPTHIEVKLVNGQAYLIELNARPGGDFIASTLTRLSTGYDYLGEAIAVALGKEPRPAPMESRQCAGVYFVTKQTAHLKPVFDRCDSEPWLYRKHQESVELLELEKNDGTHQNYMIYCADRRIEF